MEKRFERKTLLKILQQIDYQKLFTFMNPSVLHIFHSFVESCQSFTLLRKNHCKTIVAVPKNILDFNREKIDQNMKTFQQVFSDSILQFHKIVEEEMPHFDLTFFYHHLETLTIEQAESIPFHLVGEYILTDNKLLVLENMFFSIIWHELFHMASSIQVGNRSLVGFMQFVDQDPSTSIGKGLTEGYTQLLSERYFQKYSAYLGAYSVEKYFSFQLETIIGKEKMESLYSKADLYQLTKELCQYEKSENVYQFFQELDIVSLIFSMDEMKPGGKESCGYFLRDISSFLVRCRAVQLKKEWSLGLISEEEMFSMMSEFSACFEIILERSDGIAFRFLEHDDIVDTLNEVDFPTIHSSSTRKS